jgi:hypothetical protein
MRLDRLLAAQLEKLSAELAGAGAEQDREKPLPLINTDGADQEKSKTFNYTEDTKARSGDLVIETSGDRERQNLPLINTDDADQERARAKSQR